MKHILLIVLGLAHSLLGFSGKVIDGSGSGIPSADIFLTNTSEPSKVYTARTDAVGNFAIELPLVSINQTMSSTNPNSSRGIIYAEDGNRIRLNVSYDVYISGQGIFPYTQQGLSIDPAGTHNFTVQKTDLWDDNRVVLRSSYNNSRSKFLSGTGRVAFMGGSITYRNGWRNIVENYLTKTFPNTKFDFIEAGIPSLGSKYHAFRYQRDITFKGNVDLLFLESAVNDGSEGNATNDLTRLRAHEGILRQARLDNPEIDIVQLHFLNDWYYDIYQDYDLIPSFQAYDSAGRYYNSSMQNLARYVAERYTWEEFGANVHPRAFGSSLYGDNIVAMFKEAWKDPLPDGYQALPYPLPPVPLDPFSYFHAHFVSIDNAYDVSGWKKHESWTPSVGGIREDFTNRPALTGSAGNTLKFNFKGKLIGVECINQRTMGRIRYSIDDGKYTGVFDAYYTSNLNIGRSLIFEEELPDGDHVLEIEVDSETSGSTTNIVIFNFIVNAPQTRTITALQTNLGTIVMQAQTISLFYDESDKAIAFGVNDIRTSLAKAGHIVNINNLSELEESSANTSIIIATDEDNTVLSKLTSLGVKQPGNIEDQGYNTYVTVSGDKTTYWVIGGDRIGAMYGAFHVAETINFENLSAMKNSTNTPHYERRGFKMNIPLDARTPAYSDVGDAFQENISEMWESSFWEEYLDEMARQRYNLIVLFHMHPFPSLVKLDKYPNVALNNVMTADIDWKRKSETMRLSGRDALDNNILNNLQVIKRMTIEEKIAFWQHVMQYAHDRGVKFHVVTWNIHVWGADGKHGINGSLENPTTKAYFRESVRQLINTYPLLAGVGVTAGENMPNYSPDEKERWLFETYGQGVLDALKDNPQRNIEFHHRHWWTEIRDILGHFQPVIDAGVRFDFSFKNSVAHMYSYHDPDIADPVFNELPPGYRMYNDLRNNDIYQMRWGDPDYARDYITHLHGKDKSPGLFIGTDGFLFARETVYKNSSAKRELDFKRNWYKNMIWGQLAYDPTLPNSWFKKAIAEKFSMNDSENMFKAWQASSKIIPAINRFHWRDHSFQWYPEACNFRTNKFSSVDNFINHPTMRMLDIYRIDQYCDRVINNQSMQKETPVDYYTLLTKHASEALSFANSIQTSPSTELAGTVADIKAVANLGHYYSYKIQGAINLCMYDKTKKASFKNDAISNLETAYNFWNLYNDNRKLRYKDKILLARIGMVDYDWITQKVAEDIDIAKNR